MPFLFSRGFLRGKLEPLLALTPFLKGPCYTPPSLQVLCRPPPRTKCGRFRNAICVSPQHERRALTSPACGTQSWDLSEANPWKKAVGMAVYARTAGMLPPVLTQGILTTRSFSVRNMSVHQRRWRSPSKAAPPQTARSGHSRIRDLFHPPRPKVCARTVRTLTTAPSPNRKAACGIVRNTSSPSGAGRSCVKVTEAGARYGLANYR